MSHIFHFRFFQDYVALRGEVYFPNLAFEKTTVNFGCILNDTEVTRYVNITNNSPMDVKYRWSFLIDHEPCTVVNRPPEKPLLELIMEETKEGPPAADQVEITVENFEGAGSDKGEEEGKEVSRIIFYS